MSIDENDELLVKVWIDGVLGTVKAKNKRDLKHVCGSHGFGWGLDDICPRCELDREAGDNARHNVLGNKD